MGQILIVDDEPSIGWALREALGDDGHVVQLAASAEEGLQLARQQRPDTVILDVRLPGMDGLSALQALRSMLGAVPVVIMTAFGSLDTAVRAIKAGAFDYLVKPFDLDHAARVVSRALEASSQAPALQESALPNPILTAEELLGSGTAMQRLYREIALVAPTEVAVLITGESGTGKELVARAIHKHGSRRDAPFVPVCVPALSPSLVERELFGHVRGAFTGAESDQPGLLERAGAGTAFLDEIGDVALDLQVKLLRAIEYHEVVPVGSTTPRPIRARFLAATNQPLDRLIATGRFREDLYFRLSVFPIRVPAISERPEDIPVLATHFARQALRVSSEARVPIAPETLQALSKRPWPGNVRELRNAIEYAAIVARGDTIRPEHLPRPAMPAFQRHGSQPDPAADLARRVAAWAEARLAAQPNAAALHDDLLAVVEPPLLRAALDHCGNQRLAAAACLGMHRATLRQKLRKYDLDQP